VAPEADKDTQLQYAIKYVLNEQGDNAPGAASARDQKAAPAQKAN
jgi:hypothetical protein